MKSPVTTCLSTWQPLLERAGIPTPRTVLVSTNCDLIELCDGKRPAGFAQFIRSLRNAVRGVGVPFFLRTGYGSGKHDWSRTCYCPSDDVKTMEAHVCALVEWSHTVDMLGLPTNVWAVRELLETKPLFICTAYGGFPVVREFRFFVKDRPAHPKRHGFVEHVQPYWPIDACEQGRPDREDWREVLAEASKISIPEYEDLRLLAFLSHAAVGGGFWSVDVLQDASGSWWVTDMAEGARSYRYDPETQEHLPSDPSAKPAYVAAPVADEAGCEPEVIGR